MAVAVTHTVTGLTGLTGGDLLPASILTGFDYNVAANAEGDGGLVLPYGQSLTPLAKGRVIVVRHDGVPVHSWVIDAHREHPIAIGMESDQLSRVTGLGLAGLLSRYMHRDTLGFEATPWARTRTWSCFSLPYDPSSWGSATEYGTLMDPSDFWDGLPDGFPAFDVNRIGPSSGDDFSAPQGYWWTQKDFFLPEPALLRFATAADNAAAFFFDGFQLGRIDAGADTTAGFATASSFTVYALAGTHRVGAKVINTTPNGADPGYGMGPEIGGNPTFFMCVGYTVAGDGQTFERVVETDSSWKIKAYPDDPPGMTLPQIVEEIIEENWLDGIMPKFTVDANGTFPELESVTADVDRSLLELLRDQWAPAGLCDWHVPPTSLEIQLWPYGERGSAQDVTYLVNDASPMESSLRDLSIYSIDEDTDCLMVAWQGGWIRVPESGGSRMGAIRTDSSTPGEARSIGEAVLAGDPSPEQYAALIAPTGTNDVPGVDYDCGDSVVVAGSRQAVIGWGGRLEIGSGIVEHSILLKDRILDEDERMDEVLRRAAPGQRADAPTSPASAAPRLGSTVRSSELIFQYDAGAPEYSPIKRASGNGNLYAVTATATPDTGGGTDTLFAYYVGGVDVLGGAGVLPAGEPHVIIPVNPHVFVRSWTTQMQARVSSLGTGLETVILEPWFW